MFDDSTQESRR